MSENEPSAAALEAAHNITEFADVVTYHEGNGGSWSAVELDYGVIARHFDAYAAARVAEAVAAERARIERLKECVQELDKVIRGARQEDWLDPVNHGVMRERYVDTNVVNRILDIMGEV